uniref:Uncharacterized protein n=1 Tax=Marinobacter nauticus TaxID=2743 RepID=A0A455W7W1_MARNT|nr:hypothetical protein YBY_34950 [Marinobacter nauticus]
MSGSGPWLTRLLAGWVGFLKANKLKGNDIMNTKKSLLAAAIAMSMGISGYAMAQQGGDGWEPVNKSV